MRALAGTTRCCAFGASALPNLSSAWFPFAVGILIVQPHRSSLTETFIHVHSTLPNVVAVVHGFPAEYATGPVLGPALWRRALRRLDRVWQQRHSQWEMTRSLMKAIKHSKADVVLAEYGPTGVYALEACRLTETPLVVHFHGFDASQRGTLEQFYSGYQSLFESAQALVVVSRAMERTLLGLGAPPEKISYCAYGVDTQRFSKADPRKAPPTLLAVGRLVDKKAPQLTLLAFAKALKEFPEAKLRIVGDGPLRGVCESLARAMDLTSAVTFLGAQSSEVVCAEMRKARAFVQHSVEARDGDQEGMPVAIIEASACGLPVISTIHAGIPEIVGHEETGLLSRSFEVDAMAQNMARLLGSPELAARLGARGREVVLQRHSLPFQLTKLNRILQRAVATYEPPHSVTAAHQNSVMFPVG